MQRLNAERYKRAYELREEGMTFRKIGVVLGVSRNRAWQMVGRYREFLLYGLPLSGAERTKIARAERMEILRKMRRDRNATA